MPPGWQHVWLNCIRCENVRLCHRPSVMKLQCILFDLQYCHWKGLLHIRGRTLPTVIWRTVSNGDEIAWAWKVESHVRDLDLQVLSESVKTSSEKTRLIALQWYSSQSAATISTQLQVVNSIFGDLKRVASLLGATAQRTIGGVDLKSVQSYAQTLSNVI
jgi:hypothetical protein